MNFLAWRLAEENEMEHENEMEIDDEFGDLAEYDIL